MKVYRFYANTNRYQYFMPQPLSDRGMLITNCRSRAASWQPGTGCTLTCCSRAMTGEAPPRATSWRQKWPVWVRRFTTSRTPHIPRPRRCDRSSPLGDSTAAVDDRRFRLRRSES